MESSGTSLAAWAVLPAPTAFPVTRQDFSDTSAHCNAQISPTLMPVCKANLAACHIRPLTVRKSDENIGNPVTRADEQNRRFNDHARSDQKDR